MKTPIQRLAEYLAGKDGFDWSQMTDAARRDYLLIAARRDAKLLRS